MQDTALSFGTPPEWDEETDIAIIGSGYAGLAAAAAALESGAGTVRVVILEKMPYPGGNSIISGGGYCSSDSKLKLREKLSLGEDSWQLHMDDTIKGGANQSLPELAEVMAKKAPDGLNMFIDAGVEFAGTLPRMGGHSAHRSYLTVANDGKALYDPLRSLALSKGAELRLKTAVTRIWRASPYAPVEGVQFDAGGAVKNLRVKRALIMASGGFSRDVEMRVRYNPQLTDAYNCTNHKGATGECIRMAQAVGAGVIHMEHIQLFPTANPDTGLLDKYALAAYSGTGYGALNVDRTGRRFVNELGGRDEVSNVQITSCDKPTYTILNRAIFVALDVAPATIDSGVTAGRVIAAETISSLAGALGMPYLVSTVETHNGYITGSNRTAAAGEADPEFGKPISAHMIPMTQGPYYAIPQWPAVHFCMGGLRFDTDAHVLGADGVPIPRFYAAGECCGGLHGANRIAGNAIAECIVFGRIAGARAALEDSIPIM